MTMHNARVLAVFTTLFVSGLLVTAATRTGTPPAGAQSPPFTFQHVIIIVQENRTPDNLFQGLCTAPYGSASSCSTTPSGSQYDIKTSAWLDKFAPGGTIAPKTVPLANTYDLDHSHRGWLAQCDLSGGACKMDGRAHCSGTCLPTPQFRYVDNSTGVLNPYLELATQYGWANAMFQTNQGPSYPAHQFLFGGTSAPSASDDAAGIFASENIVGTGGVGGFDKPAGCAAPSGTLVMLIHPGGSTTTMYPCFEHQTMADLFHGGVTWRYYAPAPGTIWTAPNSIKHICQSSGMGGSCTGPMWTNHLDFKARDVLNDIASCSLRSVSWVIPAGPYSDHAGPHSGSGGPAWIASIVNAIGKNTSCDGGKGYWNDTAIVLTWDDWGGWYDHVAPTILAGNQGDYQYGFRVPLLVVSAYTPKGYVNNVHHDFGTILRFVQRNFGITEGALNFADKRADGDLRAFFDFAKPPRPFTPIAARPMPAMMANDTSPPDDD